MLSVAGGRGRLSSYHSVRGKPRGIARYGGKGVPSLSRKTPPVLSSSSCTGGSAMCMSCTRVWYALQSEVPKHEGRGVGYSVDHGPRIRCTNSATKDHHKSTVTCVCCMHVNRLFQHRSSIVSECRAGQGAGSLVTGKGIGQHNATARPGRQVLEPTDQMKRSRN
jgi:hypothetical protein